MNSGQVLLDSTELVDILRGRGAALDTLNQMVVKRLVLATTAVNVGEVYSGIRPGEENSVEAFLADVKIYPVTAEIARNAGLLRNAAARKGRTLDLDDMIIAATALEYGVPLFTKNRKDFTGSGVTFFDI